MKGFIKILKNSHFLKKIHIFAFLFCILSGFRELYLTHSLQKSYMKINVYSGQYLLWVTKF